MPATLDLSPLSRTEKLDLLRRHDIGFWFGGTLFEAACNPPAQLLQLHLGQLGRERFASEAWIAAQHRHLSRVRVRDAGSVVDECLAVAILVPRVNVLDADLEFQCRGDSVADLSVVVLEALPVLVQVDESGRHNHAGCIDDSPPFEALLADGGHAAGDDPYVADAVQSGFRVNYTAAADNDVEWNLGDQRCREEDEKRSDTCHGAIMAPTG